MKNEKPFEEMLRKAVQLKYDDHSIEIPPIEESWVKIEQQLIHIPSKKTRHQIHKRVGWIVAATIIMLTIVIGPQTTTAFSKLFHIFEGWKDDMTRIVTKSPVQDKEANHIRPYDTEEFIKMEPDYQVVTLEEARRNIAFALKLPHFLNDEYQVKEISIWKYNDDRKSDKVRIDYERAGVWFSIVEEVATDRSLQSQVAIGAAVEDVMIGDHAGVFITFSSELIGLEWIDDQIKFSIYGKLTKDQILYIADRF